jgi:maleate isomerase
LIWERARKTNIHGDRNDDPVAAPRPSLRVGLIVPSSNTVMEPDFHRHLPANYIVSTTRIFLEEVTRDAEFRMLREDLPRAAQLIRTTAPDVVVFGCTSAGSLEGLAHDAQIGRSIHEMTQARTVTVVQALLAQLQRIRPNTVAVLTPYLDEMTNSVVRCVIDGGYSVVKAAGMGLRENLEIGNVSPSQIVDFVEEQLQGANADCLFLSCTNWRAMEAIGPLESKLGIPIITSNQAVIEAVVRSAD